MTRQIQRAVARFGADSVLVTSFSRAAAAELTGRDLPISKDRVGTLHSHCWHALGGPEIAESRVDEWNVKYPTLALTPQKKQGRTDGEEAFEDDDTDRARSGDQLLQQVNRFRGLGFPMKMWPALTRDFEKKWTEYKRANDLLDFTDLIETCLRDVFTAPKNPSVIFADEAQDLNRMQLSLIRKWGERSEYLIVAGDDDQASLPGSQVLVEGGQLVQVECLDPALHRLVSYSVTHSQLRGLRQGFNFEIQPSMYRGQAVKVSAGGRATRTTHNHPWLFRWTAAARTQHVVYLMQKGRSFRVGWCKLMRSDNCSHLGVRAHQERADAAWILKVCESRREASLWESCVAASFGITTALWRPIHDQRGGHYTAEVIAKLTEMLGDQTERARCCLEAFGRDIALPFYERGKTNRYGAQINKSAAANLLPGVMALPVAKSTSHHGVVWEPVDAVERFPYEGCVYGLSVPPDHTYIADGIVTHNCIYGFTGAAPEAMLDPDVPADHKIILKQSYRVPRAVHALSENLIRRVTRRQEKEYLPRPEDGAVERLARDGFKRPEVAIVADAVKHIEAGKTVMFLATCSYMLRPLINALREAGIAFHNPYRKTNGFWNPLRVEHKGSTAGRVLALMAGVPEVWEDARPWTNGDVAQWAQVLQSRGVLVRGAKTEMPKFAPEHIATFDAGGIFARCFEPEALNSLAAAWQQGRVALLEWWKARLNAEVRPRAAFPVEIVKRLGARGLVEAPQVVVGTIHSVKGGQADIVYLFPDLSQAGAEQYARQGVTRDAVIRVAYVGATRARERLVICQRETAMAIVDLIAAND